MATCILKLKTNYINVSNYDQLFDSISAFSPDIIFHLAAQSRIQPAIKNPIRTVRINCEGTTNVLQCSRIHKIKKVIY